MNSASDKLAALIAERLVREKLLTRTEAKKILSKLAAGKLNSEEWRAAVEVSTQQRLKS
jgi:hypothetical protein